MKMTTKTAVRKATTASKIATERGSAVQDEDGKDVEARTGDERRRNRTGRCDEVMGNRW